LSAVKKSRKLVSSQPDGIVANLHLIFPPKRNLPAINTGSQPNILACISGCDTRMVAVAQRNFRLIKFIANASTGGIYLRFHKILPLED
jgi:hypothetical protein